MMSTASDSHKLHVILSERESMILALIADGHTDGEIGAKLGISPKTVNYHVENIKRNFRVRSRLEAVVKAFRAGLLQ